MGGGDTYLRNLIRLLPSVAPDIDFTLFLTPAQREISLPGMDQMKRVIVGPNSPQLRIPLSLPVAVWRAGIDVLHCHFLAPPFGSAKTIITVHDISFEHGWSFFSRGYTLQYRALMPLMARRADTILTISEFSRQDIIRRYCVPPEKVVVAHGAADPMFRPIEDPAQIAAVRAKYATGERFILSVGEIQPRKNLKTLIEAYVRLRRAGTICHKLVLVGKPVWLYHDTFAAARECGFADDLIFTGYVPDEDLVLLYNAADIFVYPSLFEGFGLPPLEAMACGTPVITSNTSSLPEVVGNVALTVEPLDVEAFARVIAETANDGQRRLKLRQEGLLRATSFSWERTAHIVAQHYNL